MVVGELATCAASELAENLAEELGVRLVKKEAASIAVAFLTTEALKVSADSTDPSISRKI